MVSGSLNLSAANFQGTTATAVCFPSACLYVSWRWISVIDHETPSEGHSVLVRQMYFNLAFMPNVASVIISCGTAFLLVQDCAFWDVRKNTIIATSFNDAFADCSGTWEIVNCFPRERSHNRIFGH
jgi:hypothetical protein